MSTENIPEATPSGVANEPKFFWRSETREQAVRRNRRSSCPQLSLPPRFGTLSGRRPPEKHVFHPLSGPRSIRLLSILQVDRIRDVIYCTIIETNLDDRTDKYLALSYTWGSPLMPGFNSDVPFRPRFTLVVLPFPGTSTILYDDVCVADPPRAYTYTCPLIYSDPYTTVPLSQNLSDFFWLNAVEGNWAEGKKWDFWIDSLCIDQSNPNEVSQQIAMMTDIYRLARAVVIWLGPDTSDFESLEWLLCTAKPALLRKAKELGDTGFQSWIQQTSPAPPEFWTNDLGVQLLPGKNHWDILKSFANFMNSRSWFYRAWVAQEAAAHPRRQIAFVGNTCFHFEELSELDSLAERASWYKRVSGTLMIFTDSPFRLLQGEAYLTWYRLVSQVMNWTYDTESDKRAILCRIISRLLQAVKGMRATLPEDKFFSILGVIVHHGPALNLPDIMDRLPRRKVTSAGDIFTAVHHILFDLDALYALDLLTCVRHSNPPNWDNVDSPSWVVDWSDIITPRPITVNATAGGTLVNERATTGLSATTMMPFVQSRRLFVHGRRCSSISQAISSQTSLSPTLSVAMKVLRHFGTHYPKTGQRIEVVLSAVLSCSNSSPSEEDRPEAQAVSDLYCRALVWFPNYSVVKIVEQLERIPEKRIELDDKAEEMTQGMVRVEEMVSGCMARLALDEPSSESSEIDTSSPENSQSEPLKLSYTTTSSILESILSAASAMRTLTLLARREITASSEEMEKVEKLVGDMIAETDSYAARPGRKRFPLTSMFPFMHNIQRLLANRVVFITDDNYLGLGPEVLDPEKGDEVWLLAGCDFPVVLRPVAADDRGTDGEVVEEDSREEERPRYRFLGAGFVYGMMRGELITEETKKEFKQIAII